LFAWRAFENLHMSGHMQRSKRPARNRARSASQLKVLSDRLGNAVALVLVELPAQGTHQA